jgi:outer membrane protein TolC
MGLFSFLFFVSILSPAQIKIITIERCYELARLNYPLIKKHDLISRSSNYSIENAGRLYLPQFSISGQASYQSQTLSFPAALGGPGILLPAISKDQYKIQAEVDQTIYDGGMIKNQQELIRVNTASEQQNLEVNLYAIRDRITQLYFSILLMDEQKAQNDIKKNNFQSAADQEIAAYQNGTALKSNVDEFQAEIANTEMTNIELKSNRKAYTDMLSVFTGLNINGETELLMPPQQLTDPIIRRPELSLFDLEKNMFNVQEKQLKTDYMPKLNAFIQAAYGRPTLNFIENEFGSWWIGGIRLFWNLGSLYSLKNNRNNLRINKEYLDIDKETFIYNTNLSLSRQNEEVLKYAALLRQDDTVISLRTSVASTARSQLDNGVITVHDYISKINEENLARQTKILHSIQLIQAQYQYKNTSGN